MAVQSVRIIAQISTVDYRNFGLEPVVFEQADGVGGQWHAPSAHSGIWPGMHEHQQTLDAFSDFRPPNTLRHPGSPRRAIRLALFTGLACWPMAFP
jgi:hypothetical protein